MRWKQTTAIAFFTILLALAFTVPVEASITVPTTAYFGCGSGAYITFDDEKTFSDISQTFQTTGWYFDSFGLECQSCNVTVTDLFVNNPYKVYLTVSSTEAASATVLLSYSTHSFIPSTVQGAAFTYASLSNVVTLTQNLIADLQYEVVVSWVTSDGGVGQSEPTTSTPTPLPTSPPLIPVIPTAPPFIPEPTPFPIIYFFAGVCVLGLIAIVVYVEENRRSGWKKLKKKKQKVDWKR